jgi:hypothetical protein
LTLFTFSVVESANVREGMGIRTRQYKVFETALILFTADLNREELDFLNWIL